MNCFVVSFFDNSEAAQNHGVWAAKPSTTHAMHTQDLSVTDATAVKFLIKDLTNALEGNWLWKSF